MAPLYAGIEAGGTKFVCAVASGPDDVRATVQFPTTSPEETIGRAMSFFREQDVAPAAAGIASFGPVDLDPRSPTFGYITSTPKPGWADTEILGAVRRGLGVPVGFEPDVTGAAQGIGLETAKRLASTHRLALLDLNAELLDEIRPLCGDDAVAVVCDIAEQDQVTAAVAEVVEECGGIDVLFSNAGIGAGGSLRHLDPEVLEAIIDVNLIGNWRVIHACLPHIIERRGYVLANASASAIMPAMGLGPYAASKAAMSRIETISSTSVNAARLPFTPCLAAATFRDSLRRQLKGPPPFLSLIHI